MLLRLQRILGLVGGLGWVGEWDEEWGWWWRWRSGRGFGRFWGDGSGVWWVYGTGDIGYDLVVKSVN